MTFLRVVIISQLQTHLFQACKLSPSFMGINWEMKQPGISAGWSGSKGATKIQCIHKLWYKGNPTLLCNECCLSGNGQNNNADRKIEPKAFFFYLCWLDSLWSANNFSLKRKSWHFENLPCFIVCFMAQNWTVPFSIRGKTELIVPLITGAFEKHSRQTGLLGTLNSDTLNHCGGWLILITLMTLHLTRSEWGALFLLILLRSRGWCHADQEVQQLHEETSDIWEHQQSELKQGGCHMICNDMEQINQIKAS